ncbi:hypothetical protein SD70_15485 [Gordoniibacillus kamchatkensis]|uniref:Uncharacterized protein n=1 Tax=Gordoniibacillus kamchatkensis TaxID=1590651 RepID=A0ABR5AIM4_9BACL|nr:hypothetical protein [Paenibacillus sp. VKM B-2647]KIL40212.1 hypothetical protein SD70_15485 [Paenibacillus sp. VKM B-2647]
MFFGADGKPDDDANGIRPVSLLDLARLNRGEYGAVVTSPYLLPCVRLIQPRIVIAIAERRDEADSSETLRKFHGLMAAQADLIATSSEKIYLEMCFRYDHVLYMPNDIEESGTVWTEAISAKLRGESTDVWMHRQWEAQAAFYRNWHERIGDHETICYLLASYQYLLGRSSAKSYLSLSFEQMMIKEFTDCLRTHYRFFSAMDAKEGDLEAAVRVYAITALTDEERSRVRVLQAYLDQGRTDLAKAELFRLNDDYRNAIGTLLRSDDPEAGSHLLRCYLPVYRYQEALQLLERIRKQTPERYLADLLRGTLDMLSGKRHEAIHAFLRAAAKDWLLLGHMAELERWELETEFALGRHRHA